MCLFTLSRVAPTSSPSSCCGSFRSMRVPPGTGLPCACASVSSFFASRPEIESSIASSIASESARSRSRERGRELDRDLRVLLQERQEVAALQRQQLHRLDRRDGRRSAAARSSSAISPNTSPGSKNLKMTSLASPPEKTRRRPRMTPYSVAPSSPLRNSTSRVRSRRVPVIAYEQVELAAVQAREHGNAFEQGTAVDHSRERHRRAA